MIGVGVMGKMVDVLKLLSLGVPAGWEYMIEKEILDKMSEVERQRLFNDIREKVPLLLLEESQEE